MTLGYRFYSSIEHSDVLALSGYFGDEDEDSMMILSEPSDSHVALVLGHSFAVMADILECVCRYFNVDEPQIFDRVRRASEALFPQPGA